MSDSAHERLFDELLEGVISETDFLKLEAEMIVDDNVRKAYYERLKLHTALQSEMESGSVSARTVSLGSSPRKRADALLVTCLVVMAILIGLLVWKMGGDRETYLSQEIELVARGFGVLANESADTRWNDLDLTEGDMLPSGTIELEVGIVKLEFFNGVDIVVHGPARFEVVSDFYLRLDEGKVLCRVPESFEGFRVGIPSGEIVDFGTEFEVEVADQFELIDVLSGLVEWQGKSGAVERIEAGSGVRFSGESEVARRNRSVSSMSEIESGFQEAVEQRHEDWKKRLTQLQEDPRVLALFSMERADQNNSKMVDLSGQAEGTVIRTERAMNRWGNPYGGIDFTPTGSRIHLDIEGELESLTLMSWVKIDSLDRLFNSLFLTDGHEQYEPHWQILNDGRMFFSVKAHSEKKGKDKHIAYSPPIWTPEKSGQWMHLASVYDGKAFTTTHYVNGKAVSIDQIPKAFQPDLVRIGSASIGNWSEPRYKNTPEFAVRNLNGTIDEFILFSAPLGAGEIKELYETGKP